MRKIVRHAILLMAVLAAGTMTACTSTTKKVDYKNEDFSSTTTYSQVFPGSGPATCEAARRALLSQGYLIDEARASQVNGRKNFQPDSDVHLQIQFHVVCAPNSAGSNSTTVFANAVRDRYSLKKSSNSASLGVGVLGSLSVPIGSIDESLVKVASETIPSKKFYERFFELVDSYLDTSIIDPVSDVEHKPAPQMGTGDE